MPDTDYIALLTANRNEWAELSNELEGEEWNDAFDQFNSVEKGLLQQAGGHPTGTKPRARP